MSIVKTFYATIMDKGKVLKSGRFKARTVSALNDNWQFQKFLAETNVDFSSTVVGQRAVLIVSRRNRPVRGRNKPNPWRVTYTKGGRRHVGITINAEGILRVASQRWRTVSNETMFRPVMEQAEKLRDVTTRLNVYLAKRRQLK